MPYCVIFKCSFFFISVMQLFRGSVKLDIADSSSNIAVVILFRSSAFSTSFCCFSTMGRTWRCSFASLTNFFLYSVFRLFYPWSVIINWYLWHFLAIFLHFCRCNFSDFVGTCIDSCIVMTVLKRFSIATDAFVQR